MGLALINLIGRKNVAPGRIGFKEVENYVSRQGAGTLFNSIIKGEKGFEADNYWNIALPSLVELGTEANIIIGEAKKNSEVEIEGVTPFSFQEQQEELKDYGIDLREYTVDREEGIPGGVKIDKIKDLDNLNATDLRVRGDTLPLNEIGRIYDERKLGETDLTVEELGERGFDAVIREENESLEMTDKKLEDISTSRQKIGMDILMKDYPVLKNII